MNRPVFPAPQFTGATLTLEQWQLIEALGNSLSPEQLRWVSGYFAGLDAALSRDALRSGAQPVQPPARAAAATASRTLTILYASETGNGAGLAAELGTAATRQGLRHALVDMADYKVRNLKDEQDLLIITSTHGEGDPPQPGLAFFEFLESNKAPKLPNLRYAVLALGDLSYEFFCAAGKRLDERLEALGAKRLHPRVECDVDYETPAAGWSSEVLALLAAEQAASAAPAAAAPPATAFGTSTIAAATPAHDKRNPFQATVIDSITLAGRGSTRETRHIELSIADSGLHYEPGDALGIVARNDPAVVETLLHALDLPEDARVTVKGEATTLAEALATRFEITTTTRRFLEHWNGLGGTAASLLALEGNERTAFLQNHHIIDIVRAFPLKGLDPQQFVDGLRPLQPRLYSIASSLAACSDEVHLTVSPVRYALHDSPRSGVVSGHLADRVEIDGVLPVYIQPNSHFRLPNDERPIIMIGAGTGVAPYRAFMQQREVHGGGRSWLFFGERNFRTDFFYQTEWQDWLKSGTLSRMEVAFSRDGTDKVYVQHRLREQARDVYAWLDDGASIYVCGDASRLAPDVHEALVAVVEEQAGIGREDAEGYLRDLQRDGRYLRDVY